MTTRKLRIPKLCHHKSKNLGYATDPRTKKEIYFGSWGLRSTKENYLKWAYAFESSPDEIVIDTKPILAHLVARYIQFATSYFRDPITKLPTSALNCMRAALKDVALYLSKPIEEFTPQDLIAIRTGMMRRKQRRTVNGEGVTLDKHVSLATVNSNIKKIRGVFKKGVEWGMVPIAVYSALQCVQSLNYRSAPQLKINEPVAPVEESIVEELIPLLRPIYQVALRLQLATGMRLKELCSMRFSEIKPNKSKHGLIYIYRPSSHKNSHRGQARSIPISPALFAELRSLKRPSPSIKGNGHDVVFYSNGTGKSIDYSGPLTASGYRQVIGWGQKRLNKNRTAAGLEPHPRWNLAQIRHTVLTRVREGYGLEAAQAVGGHKRMNTTEIYAEKNDNTAIKIALGK